MSSEVSISENQETKQSVRSRTYYVCQSLVLLTALIAFGGLVSWMIGSTSSSFPFQFNVWGDRDLWRGLSLDQNLPPLGPEMIGGKRMPGGMFAYLLAGIMSFGESAVVVNSAIIILTVITGVALSVFCWREHGIFAGAICLTVFATSPYLILNTWIWNPAFILPFSAGIIISGYYFLKNDAPFFLCVSLFLYAAGVQIHGQLTPLILVVLVYAIVAPCRPRGLWILASLVAFLLPFLPYFIWDSAQGFSYSRGFFDGYAGNYWSGGFDSNNIFFRLFSGDSIIGDLSSRMSVSKITAVVASLKTAIEGHHLVGKYPTLAVAASFGILLVESSRTVYTSLILISDYALSMGALIGILGAVFRLFRLRSGAYPALFIASIPIVVFLISLKSSVYDHHLVGTFPAMAIMASFGMFWVYGWLARNIPKVAIVFLVFICIAVIPRNSYMLRHSILERPNTENTDANHFNSELVTYVREKLGFSLEDLNERVAKFYKKDGNWQIYQTWTPATFDYLTSPSVVNQDVTSSYRCVAAMLKKSKEHASFDVARGVLIASAPMQTLKVVNADFTETKNLFLFLYNTASGNCAKNLSNPYIPTAFEKKYLAVTQVSDEFKIENMQIDEGEVLAVVHDTYQRFPTGFRMLRDKEALRVEIHGRASRGYTGLKEVIFKKTRMFLVNLDTGNEIEAPLPDDFGSVNAYTPWLVQFKNIPDGTYRVGFYGELLRPEAFTPWLLKGKKFLTWDLKLAEIEISDSKMTLRAGSANSN
jgi:hypothetical protein